MRGLIYGVPIAVIMWLGLYYALSRLITLP